MKINDLSIIVGLLGTLMAIYGTYKTIQSSKENSAKKESYSDAAIKMDIEYIKKRSDENIIALKEINLSVSDINERIARVEERTNEAHKRIDRIIKKEIN